LETCDLQAADGHKLGRTKFLSQQCFVWQFCQFKITQMLGICFAELGFGNFAKEAGVPIQVERKN